MEKTPILNDFAHIPWEGTPDFPKPTTKKFRNRNCWWRVRGIFQGYVGEILDIRISPTGFQQIGCMGPHFTSQDAYIRTSESLSAIVADYALDDDKLLGLLACWIGFQVKSWVKWHAYPPEI